MAQRILLIITSILLSACTTHLSPRQQQQQSTRLYQMIIQNNNSVNRAEAKKIAKESVSFSSRLSKEYKVSTPPLIHNLLVNIGAKERGLCYQWSDDLYLHLKQYSFHTITLKPVGAFVGSYWREHNALAVLPKGSSDLNRGVLLDPWRESGKLYFVPINRDPEYKWQIRNDRCEVYN